MSLRVALGPRSPYVSWQWVGEDIVGELSKHFDVTIFGDGEVPAVDALIVIKQILSPRQMAAAKANGSRVFYVPVDYFRGVWHIRQRARFLKACDLILLHAPALAAYLKQYAPVRFVDHHGKFSLPTPAEYKETGYALWIGAIENLPYLLCYLRDKPLPIEVKVLTNSDDPPARETAVRRARELGAEFRLGPGTINGMEMQRWSPQLQSQMMYEAKAAIDIKGPGFNQIMKPPTKAQKYVCSGLPLAMNACPITQYLNTLGLPVPEPTDGRWLTRAYHGEVCGVAQRLRPSLTLESVAATYKTLVEQSARQHAAFAATG